ncbi:hypothetical protein HZS_1649 [Henneguya salminicola]|nr:hypothetical protein HZS_1649 [Henneguya salminicola]
MTEITIHTCQKKVIISKKIETPVLTLELYTKDFIESKSNVIHIYPNTIYQEFLSSLKINRQKKWSTISNKILARENTWSILHYDGFGYKYIFIHGAI